MQVEGVERNNHAAREVVHLPVPEDAAEAEDKRGEREKESRGRVFFVVMMVFFAVY